MSTIKFDHSKNHFHQALGMDDADHELLVKSLADMSSYLLKKEPTKSEMAEIIANTLSYRELLYLATEGLEMKTKDALDVYSDFQKIVDKRGIERDSDEFTEAMHEAIKKSKTASPFSSSSIKSIAIDPTDIDGSLDKYDLPDEIRAELKLRILQEMRDRLRDQED
jgi:hypothetical protein